MMRALLKYLASLPALALVLAACACMTTPVHAQTARVVTTCGSLSPGTPSVYVAGQFGNPTIDVNGNGCTGAASGGGGTSSTFGAAFPAAGTAIGVKNGANMVNLTADGSSNLNVNCAAGCAGGTTSNATSGVATSSTNGSQVAYNYGFNGTSWDQLQVDASKSLKVNIASGSIANTSFTATQATGSNLHTVLDSGTTTVTQATGTNLHVVVDSGGGGGSATGSAVPALAFYTGLNVGSNVLRGQTGVNPSGGVYAAQIDIATIGGTIEPGAGIAGSLVVGGNAAQGAALSLATLPVMVAGSDGTSVYRLKTDTNGQLDVINAGTFATQDTQAGTWTVSLIPTTSGGMSNFVLEPGASDNHTVIKNGAGQVYGIHLFNNSATINYIRLYNAGTGFNGCNSATNLAWEGMIPANTSGAGAVIPMENGVAFATGISICVTGAYGQTNTTAATASAISLDVLYK